MFDGGRRDKYRTTFQAPGAPFHENRTIYGQPGRSTSTVSQPPIGRQETETKEAEAVESTSKVMIAISILSKLIRPYPVTPGTEVSQIPA